MALTQRFTTDHNTVHSGVAPAFHNLLPPWSQHFGAALPATKGGIVDVSTEDLLGQISVFKFVALFGPIVLFCIRG